jgi:D-sedoheptulose 7-phosphate isomerase
MKIEKDIEQVSRLIVRALEHGNKILTCGNGGSAADAQHFAGELLCKFKMERKSLPAVCLNCNVSVLTAIANDYGYEQVFSRQVEGVGCLGDVLIAISTSGNSKNMVKAAKTAREKGLLVIGFTGARGGDVEQYCHICIKAPAIETPAIQEFHIKTLHEICGRVEEGLFCKKL